MRPAAAAVALAGLALASSIAAASLVVYVAAVSLATAVAATCETMFTRAFASTQIAAAVPVTAAAAASRATAPSSSSKAAAPSSSTVAAETVEAVSVLRVVVEAAVAAATVVTASLKEVVSTAWAYLVTSTLLRVLWLWRPPRRIQQAAASLVAVPIAVIAVSDAASPPSPSSSTRAMLRTKITFPSIYHTVFGILQYYCNKYGLLTFLMIASHLRQCIKMLVWPQKNMDTTGEYGHYHYHHHHHQHGTTPNHEVHNSYTELKDHHIFWMALWL